MPDGQRGSALCADCWRTERALHGSSAEEGESRPPCSGGGGGERGREGVGRYEVCKLTPGRELSGAADEL